MTLRQTGLKSASHWPHKCHDMTWDSKKDCVYSAMFGIVPKHLLECNIRLEMEWLYCSCWFTHNISSSVTQSHEACIKLDTVPTQGLEQSSFCGSPGQRLLLSTGPSPSQQGEVVTPRLKGREMYGGGLFKFQIISNNWTVMVSLDNTQWTQSMIGSVPGPVMFGSGSSFRRNRMLSASPYSATLRSRQVRR